VVLLSLFKDLYRSYSSKVRIGNKDYVKVEGKRMVEVDTFSCTKSLKNVVYVPKINQNLISVRQPIQFSYSLFLNDGVCDIKDNKGVLLLTIKIMNKSFNVDWKEIYLCANTIVENDYVL